MAAGDQTTRPPKRAAAWLKALGHDDLPELVECDGWDYRLVQAFKHDFFAATGLYEGPAGRAVLKIGRVQRLFGLPFRWCGRYLCRREVAHYRRLAGVPGVPGLVGRWRDTGFLHEFIPGGPLERYQLVGDDFFPRLRELLGEVHARHLAYVDLQKRENIIVGDDGKPYLIDFQICLYLPARLLGRLSPLRWLLRRFQRGDDYHLLKHWRRHRPDQLTEAQIRRSFRKPAYVHLHNWLTRPFTLVRRKALKKLDPARPRSV
jgi:hypothetical protein